MGIVNDYSSVIMFSDVMMASRPWDWTASNNVTLDSLGWPTSIGGNISTIVINNDFAIDTQLPKGAYTLRCDGQATFFLSNTSATLTNVTYNSTTNKTTGTVNYNGGHLWLGISAIPNPATPPKNIKLIMPGYEAKFDSGDPFYDPFIKRLSGYLSCIRFMDYFSTNGSTGTTWATRTTPLHSTQNQDSGSAIEYAIQLCNKLNVNGWFNIPHMADDNYVQNMAQALLSGLNSNLNIYVEYSNEASWNYAGDFTQTPWIGNNIGATALPGAQFFEQVAGGYGKRMAECSRIFKSVWTGANASRMKFFGTVQTGNTGIHNLVFNRYVDPTHGAPGNHVNGICIAPYFSGSINNFSLQGGGVDYQKVRDVLAMTDAQCFASMRADFGIGGAKRVAIQSDITWKNANYPNFSIEIYECGQHLIPGILPANRNENDQAVATFEESAAGKITQKWVNLNKNSEMKAVYAEYLLMLKELLPNAIINIFNYVGANDSSPIGASRFGTWGHQRGYTLPMSQNPKLAAVMEAAGITDLSAYD